MALLRRSPGPFWNVSQITYNFVIYTSFAMAFLFQLLTLLGPNVSKMHHISYMKVIASNVLQEPNNNTEIDGPTLYFGLWGSCSQAKTGEKIQCTNLMIRSPIYDLTVLGPYAPSHLITYPTGFPLVFSVAGITLLTGFFLSYLLKPYSCDIRSGRVALSISSASLCILCNLFSTAVAFISFDKNIRDFNEQIRLDGAQGEALRAVRGSSWIFYPIGLVAVVPPLLDEFRELLEILQDLRYHATLRQGNIDRAVEEGIEMALEKSLTEPQKMNRQLGLILDKIKDYRSAIAHEENHSVQGDPIVREILKEYRKSGNTDPTVLEILENYSSGKGDSNSTEFKLLKEIQNYGLKLQTSTSLMHEMLKYFERLLNPPAVKHTL